jgi:hypothetical protein
MAAPPIPPIKLGLIATGLAVTDSSAEQAADSTIDAPSDLAPNLSSERRVTHSSSDATPYPTVFRGIGNGYRAEFVDVANAPRFGLRPVGGGARNVATAMVVQRALDSAQRAAELALDSLPAASPVHGATGLPGRHINSSATVVA